MKNKDKVVMVEVEGPWTWCLTMTVGERSEIGVFFSPNHPTLT
jgi:hypothetical protein